MNEQRYQAKHKALGPFPLDEVHVYMGSSFDPRHQWFVVDGDRNYGGFPTRSDAADYALEVAAQKLFPSRVIVHPFGKSDRGTWVLSPRRRDA